MARIDDYKKAVEIGKEALKDRDPAKLADMSGSVFEKDISQGPGQKLRFLNREVFITWPSLEFYFMDSGDEVSLQQQVLLLHYMIGSDGSSLEEKWIAYQEIPDGKFYLDAFQRRAKLPMIKAFGHQPELLLKLSKDVYNATPLDQGDVSMKVQALPRIPVALILWRGDDEFPPDGNILFDQSIIHILSAEDIAWLAGMIVYPLMGMAK